MYIYDMPRHLPTTRSQASIRRCVACGSPAERHDFYKKCAECDCSFEIRPPRSYFEMEGLPNNHESTALEPASDFAQWREQQLVERWLWFIFGAGILLSSMLLLAGT